MSTPDLSRFDRFLAIPPEDIQAREQLGLSESEMDSLHAHAVNGEVSWPYYYAVSYARKADFIYKQDGKGRGWTIPFIRKQLGRQDEYEYSLDGEHIHEWFSGRLFPKGEWFRRIRIQQEPVHVIDEVELAFASECDLERVWEEERKGFELDGILLCQQFPENPFIQELCFLPGDPNFEARLIISAGTRRKELTFPIALRYRGFLKQMERKYTIDITKHDFTSGVPLQRASTEEMQEALMGFWSGVLTYNPTKGLIPAHLEQKTIWHMGEEFKRRSVTVKDPQTGKIKRVLRSSLDWSGGSLDDPLVDDERTTGTTRKDELVDQHAPSPDQNTLVREILDILIDETDKQIVHRLLHGECEKEIAATLGITPPAVTKRLKRLGKRLKPE